MDKIVLYRDLCRSGECRKSAGEGRGDSEIPCNGGDSELHGEAGLPVERDRIGHAVSELSSSGGDSEFPCSDGGR